jgi:DNA-binding XRE family transcriptional regulator
MSSLTTPGDWKDEWPPERIKDLRTALSMTQKEMGQEIWAGSESGARKNLNRLERGHLKPTASVVRTLNRLQERVEDEGA